jgi:hypothetical protein
MRTCRKNSGSGWRLPKLLALTLMSLPMAACVTLTGGTSPPVDTSCGAFRVIHYSKDDTADTQNQVRAHNRVYHRLCPAGDAQ